MDTARNKQPSSLISNPAGRVVIDSRGRNVWQWNDDQLDSTSIMLKRLENAELALEPTRRLRKLRKAGAGAGRESRSGASQQRSATGKHKSEITSSDLKIEQTFSVKLGGGFDPYNRS